MKFTQEISKQGAMPKLWTERKSRHALWTDTSCAQYDQVRVTQYVRNDNVSEMKASLLESLNFSIAILRVLY